MPESLVVVRLKKIVSKSRLTEKDAKLLADEADKSLADRFYKK